MVSVNVNARNPEQALKDLRRAMQRELIPRKLKMQRSYESPSEAKVRIRKESKKRRRKSYRGYED